MPLRLRRALLTAALTTGAVAAMTVPANAGLMPVGVDSCETESYGGIATYCEIAISGGYYTIKATGLDDGWVGAEIGCNPSGAGGDTWALNQGSVTQQTYYLPTGVCEMRVWAEWAGRGTLTKEP